MIATDASEKQITNAQPHGCVDYRVAPAEDSGIESGTVDLIMVAQAMHWFDLDRFYAETRRVLKPDGVLAAWAYNLLHIALAIDEVVNRYYYEVVGPFWPPERKLVEEGYRTIPFPFTEIMPPSFRMETRWTLEQLLGYFSTWSATNRSIKATSRNPLEPLSAALSSVWGDPNSPRVIVWPLSIRIGSVK